MKISISPLLTLIMVCCLASCQTAKLSTALQEIERGEYYKASQTLKQVYRKTNARTDREKRAEVAWHMGVCYDKLMIPAQASASYLNAQRYGYEDPTLLLRIAKAHHHAGKYKEAIKYYQMQLEILPDDDEAKAGLEGAAQAAQWKLDGSRYEVKRFALINSRRAEFSPAIWGEEDDELYFTTSNDKVEGDETSNITGTKYCDIWVTRKDDKGRWLKPESAGEVSTKYDEGTPYFSTDGQTMYYTCAGGGDGMPASPQIYVSRRSDASWSKGTMLKIMGDTLSTIAHPAITPDGRYLYFVSDMMGGLGGLDIWRCSMESGEPGVPENLGEAINTPGDEMFPTFSPDGLLYFSSNGREGLGGLDIYSARLDDWDTWHVEHLGVPINSAGDDFGMTFMHKTTAKQEGWFSSNRNQGKGYDNIYSFLLPSITVKITGTVFDTEDEPIAEAIVRVVGRNGMNFKSVTKPDGTYEVNIDRSTEYVMMSGKQGYLNRKAQFTSDPEEEDAEYQVDFILPSITEPILVDNIFYDYNQATLREESYPSLDDLVQMLNDNPYCTIELSAHTDRVGSQAYNLDLSQRRAQSVCDYLVSQGIDEGRLEPVGYGKSEPVVVDEKLSLKYDFLPIGQVLDEEYANSLSNDQRAIVDQINRRTAFRVTSLTWGL
ncbi:MAG: PD40 domain-containing protein [Bacteroidales bacterium]|nr:PD40 domain-containing protein [Candidatus Liminaster caballi]